MSSGEGVLLRVSLLIGGNVHYAPKGVGFVTDIAVTHYPPTPASGMFCSEGEGVTRGVTSIWMSGMSLAFWYVTTSFPRGQSR